VQDVCVALDAMGGDSGPAVVFPAAVAALKLHPQLRLILVGPRPLLDSHLQKLPKALFASLNGRLVLQEATELVLMDEAPAAALRTKKDSSMRVAINLVQKGVAQACVSAGNTGALMAIARYVLKTLPGVDRPAIVSALPSLHGSVYVLDLGANVDCTAEHLRQFATMGSILAAAQKGISHPRVALLNVGSESTKGSEQVKAAHLLLSSLKHINYVGFAEGDDIYLGNIHVIVCDGFVGNVALKSSEGMAKLLLISLQNAFRANIFTKISALIAKPVLQTLKQNFDPSRYNGASLLGLQGVVIKSHGSASIASFVAAIDVAVKEAENNVPEKIRHEVAFQLSIAQ